jgi:hypothetical protein
MGYPTRTTGKPSPNRAAQSERVDALLGERARDDPSLRAVIRGDAAAAGTIALQASMVTAAPTAAQYNALVHDIQALASVLNRMGASFTWK